MTRLTTLTALFLLAACADKLPTDVAEPEDLFLAAKVDIAPIYNPANGNYYQAVAEPGILRYPARDAAADLTYRGCPGHLATITSQAENDFIAENFPEAVDGGYWLGGREAFDFGNPSTGWGWITGELFQYENWGAGEPNDAGNENHIQFHLVPGAVWNDLNYLSPTEGYMVEFECTPKGPVIEQVGGSGHFFDPRIDEAEGWEGGWRTFSFNARKYADGRVRGEYQFQNRNLDAKRHGNVTCFQVVDNKVWIGGFEETDVEGVAEGPNSVFWLVVDNGEGFEAAPDQISFRRRVANMARGSAHCTYTPDYLPPAWPEGYLDLNEIEAGNIQIK
jgi:hypothetical protein